MIRHLRIFLLLSILVFVALGQYLTVRRSTDWNGPLWVDVYAVDGSGTESARRFIDSLKPDAFASVEQFFALQAKRYEVPLEQPFRIRFAGELGDSPPSVPDNGGLLSTVLWSLRMRWFVTRLHFASDDPTPDITVFAIYSDGEAGAALDKSTALRKGMIAIANLYADRSVEGSNRMIVAHELLHTLGATDKYDAATTLPLYPSGFAEPGRKPLYPQAEAELMAGRIPIHAAGAAVPRSLDQVVIGPRTAHEIGWIESLPPMR